MCAGIAALISSFMPLVVRAADEPSAADWQALIEKQDEEIQLLKRRVESIEKRDHEPQGGSHILSDKILFSGRGAASFFSSEDLGVYPNDEFRIDEARVRLDARLAESAFLFVEANLADREDDREETWLGELYVDFEDVPALWGSDLPLSFRAGRFDIPFGEEYQHRDAIDNPLITHSLSDFWGIDEGVALFGSAGKWDYVAAVQNGSHPFFHDYNSDKAVTVRLGFNPTHAWRISLSAMRTGDIATDGDKLSELWYGGGFFRGIGDAATNGNFHAELIALSIRYQWKGGHIGTEVCQTQYDDDQPGDNKRESLCYGIECAQDLTRKCYLAGRVSRIESDDGMPIVGLGPFYPDFFFGDLVTDIWRVSAGLGYRISANLIAKAEYSIEEGDYLGGGSIDDRNMLSAQLAFAF